MHTIPYVRDSSLTTPTLIHHVNLFSLTGLRRPVGSPHMTFFGMSQRQYATLKKDGFSGVQSHVMLTPSGKKCKKVGLQLSAAGILKPAQLLTKAKKWKKKGYLCGTIMIGTGDETREEALDIAKHILEVSEEVEIPLYLELHRGTVTQNISAVLEMIKAYPGLRFNADFSHYITAYRWCETFNDKTLQHIMPILERVCYIHLRLSNSEHIQLSSAKTVEVNLYRFLLQTTFQLFRNNASAGDVLIVTPELLPRFTGYAEVDRTETGHVENSNRYNQCLELQSFAKECFNTDSIVPFTPREGCTDSIVPFTPREGCTDLNGTKIYPLFEISDIADFQSLATENLKDAMFIRVALGDGLVEKEGQDKVMNTYLEAQRKDRRICLETRRNTLTHSLQRTREIVAKHPDISLCLNLSEWVLGHEITIDKIHRFRSNARSLGGITLINPTYATAEHAYSKKKYRPWAYLSLCVITEWLYTRFYHGVWNSINAPTMVTRKNANYAELKHQEV